MHVCDSHASFCLARVRLDGELATAPYCTTGAPAALAGLTFKLSSIEAVLYYRHAWHLSGRSDVRSVYGSFVIWGSYGDE